MRILSTRVHGTLDYIVGAVLLVAPWLLGFSDSAGATASALIAGALVLGQALFTDYERGVIRAIPMQVHLGMDVVVGALLAASPWLVGYADRIWWPHVLVGLLILFTGVATNPRTEMPATVS